MYYVYLLNSGSANEIYIGSTNNLERRLTEHNNGAEISTRRYVPWSLYYYEAYPTEKLARLREKRLKHNGNSIRELKKRLDLLADRKLGLPSTTFGYKREAGFTLVEVIIYVGIVSFILVALLAVADIVQRGRTRFLISNVTQVTAARVLN